MDPYVALEVERSSFNLGAGGSILTVILWIRGYFKGLWVPVRKNNPCLQVTAPLLSPNCWNRSACPLLISACVLRHIIPGTPMFLKTWYSKHMAQFSISTLVLTRPLHPSSPLPLLLVFLLNPFSISLLNPLFDIFFSVQLALINWSSFSQHTYRTLHVCPLPLLPQLCNPISCFCKYVFVDMGMNKQDVTFLTHIPLDEHGQWCQSVDIIPLLLIWC